MFFYKPICFKKADIFIIGINAAHKRFKEKLEWGGEGIFFAFGSTLLQISSYRLMLGFRYFELYWKPVQEAKKKICCIRHIFSVTGLSKKFETLLL